MGASARHKARAVISSGWFGPLVCSALGWWLAGTVADAAQTLIGPFSALLDLDRGANLFAPTLLATLAGAQMTVLTFTVSTLMVVFTLAAGQLSPRLIGLVLQQPTMWWGLGGMLGVFVYLLRSFLRSYGRVDPAEPAALAVVGAFLVLGSLVLLFYFVNRVVGMVSAPTVIRIIARITATSIDRTIGMQQPPDLTQAMVAAPSGKPSNVVRANRDGIVTGIDAAGLLAWATAHAAVIVVKAGLGTHVSQGSRLAEIYAAGAAQGSPAVLGAFEIRAERTVSGDPPYGFRLLVDIANRALSPAINDPTTATQVVEAVQDLLTRLAQRPELPGHYFDGAGCLRVLVPELRWRDYLLMLQEIIEFGQGSSQVTQRLAAMLDELGEQVSEERASAVRELRSHIVVVPPMLDAQPPSAATPVPADGARAAADLAAHQPGR